MATHSAPPCSSLPQPPPPLSDLLPLEQHLDAAARRALQGPRGPEERRHRSGKEASQAAAEAASARELARAAEASAAASTVLNWELRGRLVSLAREAALDSELLASATDAAGRVRGELGVRGRESRLGRGRGCLVRGPRARGGAAGPAGPARGGGSERGRGREAKCHEALAREKTAVGKAAALEKRLVDERKAFQESMASFGAGGQFGGMSRGWGK